MRLRVRWRHGEYNREETHDIMRTIVYGTDVVGRDYLRDEGPSRFLHHGQQAVHCRIIVGYDHSELKHR